MIDCVEFFLPSSLSTTQKLVIVSRTICARVDVSIIGEARASHPLDGGVAVP